MNSNGVFPNHGICNDVVQINPKRAFVGQLFFILVLVICVHVSYGSHTHIACLMSTSANGITSCLPAAETLTACVGHGHLPPIGMGSPVYQASKGAHLEEREAVDREGRRQSGSGEREVRRCWRED
jgi:hypothetical protein